MEAISQARRLAMTACTCLKGVGPHIAEKLGKLGIHSLQDLLFHLPLRYEDRTRVTPIARVKLGMHILIEGVIVDLKRPVGGKTRLLCQLSDATSVINLRFFYLNRAQIQSLTTGLTLRCFGEVRFGPKGLEIVHPEYIVLREDQALPLEKCLTPVYPTTEGLHQGMFRRLTTQALDVLNQSGLLDELLPDNVLATLSLPSLKEALITIHRPPIDVDQEALLLGKHVCQQRLVFEELVAHRLSLLRVREESRQYAAPILPGVNTLGNQFIDNLSFTLTAAQQRVMGEIANDLSKSHPMMRLVQGDVGSGKTVVAAIAALQAVSAGYQVAIMAPTDILAQQHHLNFTAWFESLGVPVHYLSGKLTAVRRREVCEHIQSTKACVVIGTHALFQGDMIFNQLALVVVDEQHRFGVDQRLRLREKGVDQQFHPHQLIMTATPIPRTLSMTAYADLDNSVIDELPPGRTPVKTVLIGNVRRSEVIERVRRGCEAGRQVYWVCTLIEESEVLQCQAAEECLTQLQAALPHITMALIHGRIKSQEKESMMSSFKAGELDLLVATTVIEVGVDVPNASIMVIENPERLGLAQLHQLRGRVGRGVEKSFCVLMYQSPLSRLAKQRLTIMRDYTDGFIVAEKDLTIRGPGEVLGTKQTGMAEFRVANIVRDAKMLGDVQIAAELINDRHKNLIDALIVRWLGVKMQYAKV